MSIKNTPNEPKVNFTQDAVMLLAAALINAYLKGSGRLDLSDIDHFTSVASNLLIRFQDNEIHIENFDEIVDTLSASSDLADCILRGHNVSDKADLAERIRTACHVWSNDYINNRQSKSRKIMRLVSLYAGKREFVRGKQPYDVALDEALEAVENKFKQNLDSKSWDELKANLYRSK